MSTLGIVSSYSESCGIASFAKVLHDTIKLYSNNNVEVVKLDLQLLKAVDKKTRRYADNHIQDIYKQLKSFDAVNIQMEVGLYGSLPQDIIKRSKKLIEANPNTSITLHSAQMLATTPVSSLSPLKKLLKLELKKGISEFIREFNKKKHLWVNNEIIKNAIKQNCQIIVHTMRAKKHIYNLYQYDRVDVHPLKFVVENSVLDLTILDRIRFELGLLATDVLIGIFGFISSSKGHLDALSAIKLLPANYKLLIFGRQHPQTIEYEKANEYLNTLIKAIESDKVLKNRVFFLGELTDNEFLSVAKKIDVAWLPYYENGQEASGIASILLDSCPRVLCSTWFAFDELLKLIPYKNVMRFCIGNTHELASKTEMLLRRTTPSLPYGGNSRYNMQTQVDTYIKILGS